MQRAIRNTKDRQCDSDGNPGERIPEAVFSDHRAKDFLDDCAPALDLSRVLTTYSRVCIKVSEN